MSSPYGSTRNDITIWEVSAWLPPSENNPFPTTCLFKRLSIFVASRGLCSVKDGQATRLLSDTTTAVSLTPRAPWFCFIFPACGQNFPGSLKTGRAKRLSVAFHLLMAVDLIVPVVWCHVPQVVAQRLTHCFQSRRFYFRFAVHSDLHRFSPNHVLPAWLAVHYITSEGYLFSILSIFRIS